MNNSLNNIHKCFVENTFKPRRKSCKQEFVPISSRPGLFQRFCHNAEQFIDQSLFPNTSCKKCGQDNGYQPTFGGMQGVYEVNYAPKEKDWDVGAERRRKA